MSVHLYFNANCSKCRGALSYLQTKFAEADITIIDYLTTPPSATELAALQEMLGGDAQALVRFGDALAKELALKPDDVRSDADWHRLITGQPALLTRPIVVHQARAIIARPPELLADFFA